MISSLTTTRKDDDDFSSSSSFADRRHHHRDDARYDGREKKRTRASEGTRRVFMNREKTTRLIERLDNMTKIQREGTPLNDERLSRSDAKIGRPTILRHCRNCGNLYYTRRGDESSFGRLAFFCCCSCCCCSLRLCIINFYIRFGVCFRRRRLDSGTTTSRPGLRSTPPRSSLRSNSPLRNSRQLRPRFESSRLSCRSHRTWLGR